MTLTQALSLWTLRGLLAWGAFEGALSLYDIASNKTEIASRLAGQQEAMSRLKTRASEAERHAAAVESQAASASQFSWPLPRTGDRAHAASDTLRQALMDAGAQAPTVEASLTGAGNTQRLHFKARWREPTETAPSAAQALAARYPDLDVVSLKFSRLDVAIDVDAELETAAQTEAAP